MKNKILFLILLLVFAGIVRILTLPEGRILSDHIVSQEGFYDYQGVIHFHTNYSEDATGSFEEIAAAANKLGINFMISTDHNTLRPLEDKKEGWYGKTLFLVGEEVSLPGGYLLALGVGPNVRFPAERPGEAVAEIEKEGGLSFIAHPDHPAWRWSRNEEAGMTGEEVLDFADQWYSASPLRLLSGLFFYPFNSSVAFLQLYHRPDETIKNWDVRNRQRKFVGIFAPDFHQAVRITKNLVLRFPAAEKILPVAHDHLLLRTPLTGNFLQDKQALYEALRKGHLFFSMDLLGNAGGFLFSAVQKDQSFWMGDQLRAGQPATLTVKLPAASPYKSALIHLYRNGEEVFQNHGKTLIYQTALPGAYRSEVEVEITAFFGGTRKVVWIYSNPIFIR